MKSLIITGAGSGLGQALSLLYSAKGYHIILVGRTKDTLDKTKHVIESNGNTASTFVCDLANYEEVNKMVREVSEMFPSIVGVINSAGIGYFAEIEKLTSQEIDEMIDTNIKGTIFLTSLLIPIFKKQPEAKIMNIISTAGLRGKVNESVYVATKFAVRGFTESLVKELAETSISVTAVYMGGMATPFWEGSSHIKDPSRLKDPMVVAEKIIAEDDGRTEIFIDR